MVVVDDGSTEEEWRKVQLLSDEKVNVIQRKDGLKGPSRCRNLGVAESQGGLVMFVDSDDLLAPWCLAERMKHVDDASGYDFWVFPVMLFEQTPGDLATCWNCLEGEKDLERFLQSDPPWHTSSPLWRREAFERCGGFNEAVMYGDDADLHMRALLIGVLRYQKFPEVLPDLFIRRGDLVRITNSLSEMLLQSRLTRLLEGRKAMKALKTEADMHQFWEGQYFAEGEFLLFNHDHSVQNIENVLDEWSVAYTPSVFRSLFVRGYFLVAQATRNNAYLLLRIVRRLAILILPQSYFPEAGHFQSHQIASTDLEMLRKRLIR